MRPRVGTRDVTADTCRLRATVASWSRTLEPHQFGSGNLVVQAQVDKCVVILVVVEVLVCDFVFMISAGGGEHGPQSGI